MLGVKALVLNVDVVRVSTSDYYTPTEVIQSLGQIVVGICEVKTSHSFSNNTRIDNLPADEKYNYFADYVVNPLFMGCNCIANKYSISDVGFDVMFNNAVADNALYLSGAKGKIFSLEPAPTGYSNAIKLTDPQTGNYAIQTSSSNIYFNNVTLSDKFLSSSGGSLTGGSFSGSATTVNVVTFGCILVTGFTSLGKIVGFNTTQCIGVDYRPSNQRTYTSAYNFGNSSKVLSWLNSCIFTEIPDPTPDPYGPGGTSEPGGGTGTFDGTSTPIPIPGLPSLSAVDTGFITLFNPSLAQLKNLASYMWSGTFDLNTFKKLFADPMDCILGLSIVPVAVPNGGSQSVMVGNISTGVTMTLAGSQYVSLNCGTINVNEYWGSYLDYAPYSKASIYLPYCGVHPIDIDEIMDRTITVEYHVDILSGACVAFIMCADSVLYSFTGQCASSIPVSGNDFTQMINGIITASTAIGSMVATGGATAPVAVPQLVSTAVNSMKPEVEKSGSLSGTGGMLAIQTPYLILTIPRQALPKDQNTFTGYPSFITSTLGDLSGYTEVEEIHLDGIPATDGELSEIINLLKSGVIL